MMRVEKFTAGVKPLKSDFDAIGENRLAAMGALLDIFTGSPGAVLFSPVAPSHSLVGSVLSISVIEQSVGIGGIVGRTPAYTEDYDLDDGVGGTNTLKVEIYFVLRGYPVTATRNFQSVNEQDRVSIQALEAEIAKEYRFEVEYLAQANIAGPGQVPTIGPDDLGYVRLATVVHDGSTTTVTTNTVARFQVPAGAALPVVAHGDTHLPGGSDPIAVAELDTKLTSGSTAGLMPAGSLRVISDAVTGIVPTTGSSFLRFASTGENSYSGTFNKKVIQMTLSHNESLTVILDQAIPKLAVKFPAKTSVNGKREEAARSDHKHRLSESGYIVVNKSFSVIPDQLGTLFEVAVDGSDTPETLDQILDVKFYFEPRNLDVGAGFGGRRLEMPFFLTNVPGTGLITTGARFNIIGKNRFQVEFGSAGYLYMTAGMQGEVQSWTSPSYGEGFYPKNGTVHMVITALREGAGG